MIDPFHIECVVFSELLHLVEEHKEKKKGGGV